MSFSLSEGSSSSNNSTSFSMSAQKPQEQQIERPKTAVTTSSNSIINNNNQNTLSSLVTPRPPTAAATSATSNSTTTAAPIRRYYGNQNQTQHQRPSSSSSVSQINRILTTRDEENIHKQDNNNNNNNNNNTKNDIQQGEDVFELSNNNNNNRRASNASTNSAASSTNSLTKIPKRTPMSSPILPPAPAATALPHPPKFSRPSSAAALLAAYSNQSNINIRDNNDQPLLLSLATTLQENMRRFGAIETSARSQILTEEADTCSVLYQWISAKKYQDREKQSVKMRIPSRSVINIASHSASNSPEKKQQELLLPVPSSEPKKYQTYTEQTGRTWGTRQTYVSSTTNMNNNNNNNNSQESLAAAFEQRLFASKLASAFELDGKEEFLKQEQIQRDRERGIVVRDPHVEALEAIAARRSAKEKIEHDEEIERTIFVATVFLPELTRFVEDAEGIERTVTQDIRIRQLQASKKKYSDELKPLMENWRRREHAALTLQCAFRKIKRESFGWRRTHKQIGYEIESERRKKKQQQQQQQQQQPQNPRSLNTKLQPLSSSRASQTIAALEEEGRKLLVQKHQDEKQSFLKNVAKAREEIVIEAKWALQRELVDLSSRFFDDTTKPGMLRVQQEESKARNFVAVDQREKEYDHEVAVFEIVRKQIQNKNDMEKDETMQRQLIGEIGEGNAFARFCEEHDVHFLDTIRRVDERHDQARRNFEKEELLARRTIDAQMMDRVSETFAWHCSIVDDSLFVIERAQRSLYYKNFFNEVNQLFVTQSVLEASRTFLTQECSKKLARVCLEGRIDLTAAVFEPLKRSQIDWSEGDSRKWMMTSIIPKASEIATGSDLRREATTKIRKFWKAYKEGNVGRSGRLKYYDRVFAPKKKACAQRKMRAMIDQTQKDLENALKAANIHIVAGFSQKLKLLQKQESRAREDIETDDSLMRRIFDANMVSAIGHTCVSETTVLSRFESYHRFEIQKEERAIFARYKTFMELVFVKDVKIRPAQRAIRCHLARNARRARITEALGETQQKEQEQRVALQINQLNAVVDLFSCSIMDALYSVSFANATFDWVIEQERADREIIYDDRDHAARGYVGWLASLGYDKIEEEHQESFHNEIVESWKGETNAIDFFSLEISERNTVISHQSELATKNLLAHVESMQRMFTQMTAHSQNCRLACDSIELNESTHRTALAQEAINVGYAILLHQQESSQRSILQKHLLRLLSANSSIQQEESENRDQINKEWTVGVQNCFTQLEQHSRFTVMTEEYHIRQQLRFFASEDDWRIDAVSTRRYEILMLVELNEQSRRKSLLTRELKWLEELVDLNRTCINRKRDMFESDFCHGMRAILEAQQHEQRRIVSEDERDGALSLYEQVVIAQQLHVQTHERQHRAKLIHFQHSKIDWIWRYHIKLVRNENFRAADLAWRNCASRAVYAVDQYNKNLQDKKKRSKQSTSPSRTNNNKNNHDDDHNDEEEIPLASTATILGMAPPTSKEEELELTATIPVTGAETQPAHHSLIRTSPSKRKTILKNHSTLIARAMSNELLRALQSFIMPIWERQMALELTTLHNQLLAARLASLLQRQIDFVSQTMENVLSKDPYFQTMRIIHERNKIANGIWEEQRIALVNQLYEHSDWWLLPSYESEFSISERHALSDVEEPRHREILDMSEVKELNILILEERFSRNVISINEVERKGRSQVWEEEAKLWSEIVIEYQDTILKPLETLRHERELRAKIAEEEEPAAFDEIIRKFDEENQFQVGPQRAWTLNRRQEDLKISAQKINEPTYLDVQERQAKKREAFSKITNEQEKREIAVLQLQKWAQRKLWSAGALRGDKELAAAFAVSDALHAEVYAGIDVRDRCEKLKYSAIIIQKVFRGYKVRHPDVAKRVLKAYAIKEHLQRQKQLEDHREKELLAKQRKLEIQRQLRLEQQEQTEKQNAIHAINRKECEEEETMKREEIENQQEEPQRRSFIEQAVNGKPTPQSDEPELHFDEVESSEEIAAQKKKSEAEHKAESEDAPDDVSVDEY